MRCRIKLKKRFLIPLCIIGLMIIVYAAAMFSRDFSDFYVEKIFPYISTPFVFLSGLLPFSLGEIMIIAAIVLVVVGVPLTLILLIFRKKSRKKTIGIFNAVFLWILAFIVTTETMNCFIMYRCTPFSDKYLSPKEHTSEELAELYRILISEANELAEVVPRDENGFFYLTCDVQEECKKAMKNISEDYPQLKGYYPDAKPIINSFFMSQTSTAGVYFPFSMESNYNDDMLRVNLATTICHEFAHLKGIIQEDEANFVSFLAATKSDNPEIRYAGYIMAIEYVDGDLWDYSPDLYEEVTEDMSEYIFQDWFRFLPEKYWEENESLEIIPTDTVETMSDAFTDTNIKLNGREEGILSYGLVVELLLDYYFPAKD